MPMADCRSPPRAPATFTAWPRRGDQVTAVIARSNLTSVIPGWSEGPDPESRDSGFDALHRPGITAAEPLTRRRFHIPLRILRGTRFAASVNRIAPLEPPS